MPAYSASKAALDAFIMCLREQLRDTKVKVVHISPGVVQTEIHDFEMGAEQGRKMGIPADQFVEETWKDMSRGENNVIVGTVGGSSQEQLLEILRKREEAFDRLSELIRNLSR